MPVPYWRCIEFPLVIDGLRVLPEHHVLDVSSTKILSLWYAARVGCDIFSTDIYDYFIQQYKMYSAILHPHMRRKFHMNILDGTYLPYKNNTFDRVYSVSVIEHIEGEGGDGDTQAVLEMARVLKPGGRLSITVPITPTYQLLTTRATVYGRVNPCVVPILWSRYYDPVTLHERIIRPSGLRQLEVQYWSERLPLYSKVLGMGSFKNIGIAAISQFGPKAFCSVTHSQIRSQGVASVLLEKSSK